MTQRGERMKFIVNGEERTAREFHIGNKFTIVIYRKVKRREKIMQIDRDRFFGTGIHVYLFLKF